MRWRIYALIAFVCIALFLSRKAPFILQHPLSNELPNELPLSGSKENSEDDKFHWSNVPQRFQPSSIKPIPTPIPSSIPKIQHVFGTETSADRKVRLARLEAVKGNFTHAWKGYKDHAWLRDEVMPISGGYHDPFGGWAATLVDSLGVYLSF